MSCAQKIQETKKCNALKISTAIQVTLAQNGCRDIYIYVVLCFGGGSYWFPIFHVSIFMFPFEGGKAPVEEPIYTRNSIKILS